MNQTIQLRIAQHGAAAFGLTLALLTTAAGADEKPSISPLEPWCCVFADSQTTFHYAIMAPRPGDMRLGWSLSVERRTVSRGELSVSPQADGSARAVVTLPIPAVRDGVIVEARLEVTLLDERAQPPMGHVKRLWIFPSDAFHDRSEWLAGLRITLFDPQGKTADVFRRAGVPFTLAARRAQLEEVSEGLLVVGEGTPLADYRGLSDSLVRIAASGVGVLCLAPADGQFAMPDADDSQEPWADIQQPSTDTQEPSARRLTFAGAEVIAQLDKRFDAAAWPPDGSLVAARLAARAACDRSILTVVPDGADGERAGWPWVEARYPKQGGTLLFCGFGIVRQWDAGPVPRFLLARLFEHLDTKQESEPTPQPSED